MQKIQCIVCDIDGTIASAGQQPSQVTLKTLQRVHDAGIKFGLASGRPLYQVNLKTNESVFGFKPDLVIGFNGAQLWVEDQQKEYLYHVLQPETLKEIIDFMEPWKEKCNVWCYGDNEMIFDREDVLFDKAHMKLLEGENIRIVEDISEMYSKANAKILFRLYDENDMPALEEYIASHPSDDWIAFKTQPNLMEFAHPETSKGYAVTRYCQMMSIPIENLAAFGDMDNDLPLIEAAGMGVCMANGSDNMKKAARYITEKTCDEDGLADFIEKYILD